MQTPIKKQTTATATSIEHSLENSAKVISRDICALLGECEHVASNYDDSAGLKMYESLQEAVWKLPGVLTPGTPQEILPIQPPQPLHHLGISHTRIFIREFRSMERFFPFSLCGLRTMWWSTGKDREVNARRQGVCLPEGSWAPVNILLYVLAYRQVWTWNVAGLLRSIRTSMELLLQSTWWSQMELFLRPKRLLNRDSKPWNPLRLKTISLHKDRLLINPAFYPPKIFPFKSHLTSS